MRAAGAQLVTAISGESTTLCRLWKLTRKDGTILAFTDAVNPVVFNGVTYRSDISFTSSAILNSASGNSQNVTINVMMGTGGIIESDLRARLYDEATGVIIVCDYTHPEYGGLTMFSGIVGTVKITDKNRATIDLLPASSASSGRGIANEKYSPTCRANLGDSRCTVNIAALSKTFTVVSAIGGNVITAELGDADATWAFGYVNWTTGSNAGQANLVQQSDSATKQLFLSNAPLLPIQPGDTGVVFPGCDKLITTCRDKYNNVVNNRSEPFVPQKDAYVGPQPGLTAPIGRTI